MILILISTITGILLAIDIPSRSSMIAKWVTKDQLATAISMYSIVFGVSAIVGPSLFHPIVNYFGLWILKFILMRVTNVNK
jgi:MFS family permease